MSRDDQMKKHLLKDRVSLPDFSIHEKAVYEKAAPDPTLMRLFKIWHQGSLMQKIYNRRAYFYRAPNWLLIFSTGPTSEARALINRTLKTIIRIANSR